MELIRSMYQIYEKKEFGYELQVQSQFFMLIYLLVAKYRKTDVDVEMVKSSKKLTKLSSITDYMKSNYNKDLSLESLAQTFGYSPTYLSRMFQKYARTNYKSYLDNLRLEHAYKDLMNTDLSISAIASQNGFANSKAFAKVFQKKYGQLPSKFRKDKKVP